MSRRRAAEVPKIVEVAVKKKAESRLYSHDIWGCNNEMAPTPKDAGHLPNQKERIFYVLYPFNAYDAVKGLVLDRQGVVYVDLHAATIPVHHIIASKIGREYAKTKTFQVFGQSSLARRDIEHVACAHHIGNALNDFFMHSVSGISFHGLSKAHFTLKLVKHARVCSWALS